MNIEKIVYKPGSKAKLADFDPSYSGSYKSKKNAENDLAKGVEKLAAIQDVLYAHDKYSVLIIFQAMDAAGKDGTIKHVMSGINPQGCQVSNFKAPSPEELDHDYLWRCIKQLPERGRIGIFNRSYYEEVLVTRVHPEFLQYQRLPDLPENPELDKNFWKQRFDDINNFEKYLTNNGTIVLKFFLNVSKQEQKQRLLARIDDPSKNWKFSVKDVEERKNWDKYMDAYEQVLKNTSTEVAPWYVIPADKKWFMRSAVSNIIVERLKQLKIHYPVLAKAQKAELLTAKQMLEAEVK